MFTEVLDKLLLRDKPIRIKLLAFAIMVQVILLLQGSNLLSSLSTMNDRIETVVTEIQPALMNTRELAEKLRTNGIDTDTLSMGMTADYRAAIFEGATIVRIGTALFGERIG